MFDLHPTTGFDQARTIVSKWLRTHRTVLPYLSSAASGDFEIDRHLERDRVLAQYVTSSDDNVVVARLQHQESDRTGVFDPARNWRTEITIERDGEAAWIATRQWFAGVASDVRPCRLPNFIKSLLDENALSDLDFMSTGFRNFEYEEEAGALASLILDPDRDFPVVVLADGCPLLPDRTGEDLSGLAHVVRLTRPVRIALNSMLGSEYELNHGAIRTFYAAVGKEQPVSSAAKFETIIGWRHRDFTGPKAFAAWLHDEIARVVVLRLIVDPSHRTVESVRATLVEAKRAQLSTQVQDVVTLREELDFANELITSYQTTNSQLEASLEELTAEAIDYLNNAKALEETVRGERKRNRSLQAEKASLIHLLAAKNGATTVTIDGAQVERLIEQEPDPENVFEAVDRAKELFELYGANVHLSNTAYESAANSPFRRPKDVLASLIRLGFLWPEIRNTGRKIEDVVREVVRVPCSLHESQTTMNKFAAERNVNFDGGQATLVKHLKIGGGGPEASARIYFGDRNGQILIGHVGRHLTVANTQ